MDDRKRRREQAYRDLLENIRSRALRFLQVAPAMEDRGEIEAIARIREISACDPKLCSIELLKRNDRVTVRCHTCKRGGMWRILGRDSRVWQTINHMLLMEVREAAGRKGAARRDGRG